jgi:hypothetical protein
MKLGNYSQRDLSTGLEWNEGQEHVDFYLHDSCMPTGHDVYIQEHLALNLFTV